MFKAQVREASFLPGTRPANEEHPQTRLRLHDSKTSILIHAFFSAIFPLSSCWWPDLVLEAKQIKITDKQIKICSHGFLLAKWRK